jgi:hypothetical protein
VRTTAPHPPVPAAGDDAGAGAAAERAASAPGRRRALVLGGLAAGTVVLFVLAIALGSYRVPLTEVVRVLLGDAGADPR